MLDANGAAGGSLPQLIAVGVGSFLVALLIVVYFLQG
jgi:hypothetical protein